MKKILLVFLLGVVAVLGYYFYQGRSFNKQKIIEKVKREVLKKETTERKEKSESQSPSTPLFLEINSPQSGTVVHNPTIIVSGKTLPEAEVFINDKETQADNQGNFSLSVSLDEGENTLVILANDKEGNYQEKELTIVLESLE